MEFKLTKKNQFRKHDKDGKRRNYILYFLNGVQILKQKYPFNPKMERGFDITLTITGDYLLNGCIHQVRYDTEKKTHRNVTYPVSKKKLIELQVPNDLKINISPYDIVK